MTERREIATGSPAFTDHAPRLGGSIQGQLLRFSTHHTVAIYLRQGSLWVADFIDDQGALVDANTWFRFNCGSLANSHALRRMALESAIPLSADLIEKIEGLHRAAAGTSEKRRYRQCATPAGPFSGQPSVCQVLCCTFFQEA